MADIFTKSDAEKLLRKKTIWLFGDSNTRGLYKDLLWLLERNTLIDLHSLRGKLEESYMNDRLIKGGALHRGRNFQEIRQYKNFKLQTHIEFTFLTQCCSKDIQERLREVHDNKDVPDVVVMNSCLWDITRWGPDSVSKYKSNIVTLLDLLKSSLPPSTKVIWITTPPISNEPRGGFFIKQIEFLKHTLRFDVMEANTFVSREFILRGFDVLDIHYHLLLQIHRRRPDGIHWNPEPMRHITNLFLTHICVSWNLPLPGNFKSPLLDKLYGTSILELGRPEETFRSSGNKTGNALTDLHPQIVKGRGNVCRPRPLISDSPGPLPVSGRSDKLSFSVGHEELLRTIFAGRKRDRNGNFKDMNFTLDVFDYDYRRKRFRTGRRRNC